MSDRLDLEKIKETTELPADQSDARAEAEKVELEKKRLTPTQQAVESYQFHIDSLKERIDYHCGECQSLKIEITSLHTKLDGERQSVSTHSNRCAWLESLAYSVGYTALAGALLTAVGGLMISAAGAIRQIPDHWQHVLCYGGSGIALCGVVSTVVAFFIGQRGKTGPSS